MEEIWKDIEGYEGIYQVSNLGRLRSLDRYYTKPHPPQRSSDTLPEERADSEDFRRAKRIHRSRSEV